MIETMHARLAMGIINSAKGWAHAKTITLTLRWKWLYDIIMHWKVYTSNNLQFAWIMLMCWRDKENALLIYNMHGKEIIQAMHWSIMWETMHWYGSTNNALK